MHYLHLERLFYAHLHQVSDVVVRVYWMDVGMCEWPTFCDVTFSSGHCWQFCQFSE